MCTFPLGMGGSLRLSAAPACRFAGAGPGRHKRTKRAWKLWARIARWHYYKGTVAKTWRLEWWSRGNGEAAWDAATIVWPVRSDAGPTKKTQRSRGEDLPENLLLAKTLTLQAIRLLHQAIIGDARRF